MTNLTKASYQLFNRPNDERFNDFDSLYTYCLDSKANSQVHWKAPAEAFPIVLDGQVGLKITGDRGYHFNDWSFGQACTSAGVKKETVNRLKPATATQVLLETMPFGAKPTQVMTCDNTIRSIHGASYTRLFDADVLGIVIDEALDFTPPPVGFNGATGLYAGEQDMFAFMIDDRSWVDIDGENFAPGFFVYNSEVGKRAVGIETFWFQRICGNHIVWDATEVVSYKRKHTANVADALGDIREILAQLIRKRDERKDAFAKAVSHSMKMQLGTNKIDVAEALLKQGIAIGQIKAALELMTMQNNGYTLFNAVDALTRLNREILNAGDRVAQDSKVGALLSLAV